MGRATRRHDHSARSREENMTTPHYVPGDWKGVIAAGCVALLPPETDDAIIERLWRSMGEGEDLMSQLVIITDGRFSGLPAFAIARVEETQVHLMLRGNIGLTLGHAAGEQHFSAPSVSTWLEQIVDDATSLILHPPADDAVPGEAVAYPVTAGVVLTSHISVNLAAGAKTPVPAEAVADPVTAGVVLTSRISVNLAAGAKTPAPEAAVTPRPKRRAAVPDTPKVPDAVPNEPAPEPEAQPEPEPQPDLAQAAVHAPVPPPPGGNSVWLDSEQTEEADAEFDYSQEDHDGMTIMNSEVVALRQQLPAWEGDAVPGPLVDLADRTVVPKIVLSTGMAVALDRPVLLGRAPQVSRVKNDEMPRLITVESPNHDISRTHAEVRMSGSEIVVTDLTSTNGVLLTRPGAVAERLKPGEPTAVEAGAVVDLGEGVTFVVGRQA